LHKDGLPAYPISACAVAEKQVPKFQLWLFCGIVCHFLMRISDNLLKVLILLGDGQGICGLLSWLIFSLTSYLMVSRLKQQGIEPKTVIDIGANVGQFSVAGAKLFSGVRVHSFETLPKCLAKLRRNTTKLSNVVVHPVALGE